MMLPAPAVAGTVTANANATVPALVRVAHAVAIEIEIVVAEAVQGLVHVTGVIVMKIAKNEVDVKIVRTGMIVKIVVAAVFLMSRTASLWPTRTRDSKKSWNLLLRTTSR
ncbi:hypothetical protein FRC08_003932 [Ceratobasidium sp. 394]|nr:hypothetical protein FRC08_003932 [Ceratobasidium sp. 394]